MIAEVFWYSLKFSAPGKCSTLPAPVPLQKRTKLLLNPEQREALFLFWFLSRDLDFLLSLAWHGSKRKNINR